MARELSGSLSGAVSESIPEIRVVVLGDPHVGKTALLRQYLDHQAPSPSTRHEPTLLDSYTHVELVGTQPYRLLFTDCCSAPSFRQHRAAYLAKCDVVILVYSVRHRKSLLSLPRWMEEVVEARNSTGPARFASTTGDFSEVPIFVVGTHFGEKGAAEATSPATTEEAESVTTTCLHSAGYFVDEEDADVEEARRLSEAEAEQQRQRRARHSPRAFYNFFHRLFQSSSDGDASHKKGSTHDRAAAAPPPGARKPSPRRASPTPAVSPKTLSPSASSPALLPSKSDEARSTGTSSILGIPPGASARLPLYQLSNLDGAAVDAAMRACISLHVWLKRLDRGEALPTVLVSLEHTPRDSGSVAPCSKSGDTLSPHGSPAKTTLQPQPTLQLSDHPRSLSSMSHVSERSSASLMPPMMVLYSSSLGTSLGGPSSESPTLRHSRGVSFLGQLAITAGNSPVTRAHQARLSDSANPLSPGTLRTTEAAAAAPATVAAHPDGSGDYSAREAATATPAATVSPSNAGTAVTPGRRSVSPATVPELSETELGSPWSSPGCTTGRLEAPVPTTATRCSSPRTLQAPPAEPVTPSELNATATFAGSLHPTDLTRADTSVYHSPPNPRRSTAARVAPHRGDGKKDPAVPANGSTCSLLSSPVNTTQVGGDFSAFSGPGLHDTACACDCGAPLAVGDTPLPVRSRVWRNVDSAETSVAAERAGEGSSRTSALVTKKLALECDGRSGLTSSPTSQQNNDDDGPYEDSALRLSTPNTLTSPMPTSNTFINAPFASDACATPSTAWCSPTTQAPSKTSCTRDASYVGPVVLSPGHSQRTHEPVTPSHSPAASLLAPQNRQGAARPPSAAAAQAGGGSRLTSKAAPSSPCTSAGHAQKHKTTQCNASSCIVM